MTQAPPPQQNQPPQPEGDEENFFSTMSTTKKLGWVDRFCGYGISIVVHLVIIALLSGLTLISAGENTGTPEGTIVNTMIYDYDEKSTIESNTNTDIQISNEQTSSQTNLDVTEVIPEPEVTNINTTAAPAVGDTEVRKIMSLTSDSSGQARTAASNSSWSNFSGRRGQSQGGGGNTFFDLQVSGSNIVYVIDLSGSMANDRLPAAKRELVRSIKSLSRTSKFFIVFYNEEEFPMTRVPNLVRATSTNKSKYINWVQHDEALIAGRGTHPKDAIKMAYDLKPDTIFLLTDGEFANEKQIIELIRIENRRYPVKVSTIAYFSNQGEPLLRQIAEMTGGNFKYVDRKAVLGK